MSSQNGDESGWDGFDGGGWHRFDGDLGSRGRLPAVAA